MADLIEREPLLTKMFPCAAKRQVEEAPAVNRWIPCNERMPEANTQVLCYCRMGDFRIMEYDEQDGRWYEGIHDYRKRAVTHWMPLPEPPKNGGE